jgi:hypothetical protein
MGIGSGISWSGRCEDPLTDERKQRNGELRGVDWAAQKHDVRVSDASGRYGTRAPAWYRFPR